MSRVFIALGSFLLGSLVTYLAVTGWIYFSPTTYFNPVGQVPPVIEPPLNRYNFEQLAEYIPQPSPINFEGVITQEEAFTAYLFTYQSQGKTVSGQLNKPKQEGQLPVIVMIRGYVSPEIYQTGIGTQNAAAVFAKNGFVTVAPDFLGYGQSDSEDPDSFAARVHRPVTVLDLLASVKQLDYVDPDKIFIWGHSNGGQIALSLLEITQAEYPTTLWAPVTKPFPYSILHYADESPDYGKALRQSLAVFESVYDVDKFSIHKYVHQIQAPLQLHQGGQDDAVPLDWSNDFVTQFRQIKETDLQLEYYVYPQADHNLRPDWNTVVNRDLEFFRKFL